LTLASFFPKPSAYILRIKHEAAVARVVSAIIRLREWSFWLVGGRMMKKSDKNHLSGTVAKKIARLSLSVLQKQTLAEIVAAPISCIPNERFRHRAIMEPVMAHRIDILPNTPLKREDEYILFLQLNYACYKLDLCRRQLLRRPCWAKKDVMPLLEWHRIQMECRSDIVTGNMGLVLSMVQRVSYPGVEFADLVSEGSMALLRAADKFDCSRGFKFSTYACRAILKGFSRAAKQSYRYHKLFPTQLEIGMQKDDQIEQLRKKVREELVEEVRNIMQRNLADLSDIEDRVLRMRFSLDENQSAPLTLKQVGERLCLTKERVRQIQNKALAKLRLLAEDRLVTA
jgi:RNA polymerase sigma factor (sigma-70 family)